MLKLPPMTDSINTPSSNPETKDDNSGVYLDATGLNCPLPILKSKLALTRMDEGEVLTVDSTDPHSEIDFRAYCARSGHQLLDITHMDEVFRFVIRKSPQSSKA